VNVLLSLVENPTVTSSPALTVVLLNFASLFGVPSTVTFAESVLIESPYWSLIVAVTDSVTVLTVLATVADVLLRSSVVATGFPTTVSGKEATVLSSFLTKM